MTSKSLTYSANRLKYVVRLRRSRPKDCEEYRSYVGLEHLEPRTGRFLSNVRGDNASEESVNSIPLGNIFESGDVLFGKLRPYLAKAWVAEFPGYATTEFLIFVPIKIEARFLRYVCLSNSFIDLVDGSTYGSKMPRSDWNFIGNICIPVPEYYEQSVVVEYLDRETEQIDALVAAKKRLIELLMEKRCAVITRIVHNLDSDILAKRLKYVVSLRRVQPQVYGERRPYVGMEDIESWTGRLLSNIETDIDTSDEYLTDTIGCSIFESGDVLFGKLRPYLAKAWVAEFPGRSTTELLIMQPFGVQPHFLQYICVSQYFVNLVDSATFGSKMPRADWNFIGDINIPVPKWHEQRAIVDLLDQETAKLDRLIDATERSIKLLKERRAALITAAVTGQIDMEEMVA